MAEVIVGFRVMPKEVTVDLDRLEENIKKEIAPERIQRQPIAYGLVALIVTKFIPDAGGELEKMENKIRAIENVGEIEVIGMTRSL